MNTVFKTIDDEENKKITLAESAEINELDDYFVDEFEKIDDKDRCCWCGLLSHATEYETNCPEYDDDPFGAKEDYCRETLSDHGYYPGLNCFGNVEYLWDKYIGY